MFRMYCVCKVLGYFRWIEELPDSVFTVQFQFSVAQSLCHPGPWGGVTEHRFTEILSTLVQETAELKSTLEFKEHREFQEG